MGLQKMINWTKDNTSEKSKYNEYANEIHPISDIEVINNVEVTEDEEDYDQDTDDYDDSDDNEDLDFTQQTWDIHENLPDELFGDNLKNELIIAEGMGSSESTILNTVKDLIKSDGMRAGEVLATTTVLKYTSVVRNFIKRKFDSEKNTFEREYTQREYCIIKAHINSHYHKDYILTINKKYRLGIVATNGNYICGKPFKLKLDKDTIACGFLSKNRYKTVTINLFVLGKNKTYHWLRLRRELKVFGEIIENKDSLLPRNLLDSFSATSNNTWNRLVSPYKNEIYNYITSWTECEAYYKQLGKSYKTGILLEGPTGTGKSTTAQAIAELLGYRIVNLNFSAPLEAQFRDINGRQVVIMEELETKIGKRLKVTKEGHDTTVEHIETSKQIDLTGELLQLIDDRKKYDGVVFIATTNDKSKLDEAILREGRFDRTYYMDNFTEEHAIKMCVNHKVNSKKILKSVTYPVRPSEIEKRINEYFMLKVLNKQIVKEALKNASGVNRETLQTPDLTNNYKALQTFRNL